MPVQHGAAHRPLRADHARRPRCAAATAAPALRLRGCSPAGCPRAAATASSPAPAGCSTRSSSSASTTTSSATCADAGSSTSRRCDWLAGYRFAGDVWGYAEGEVYFPGSPLLVVEAHLRRGACSSRRCCCRSSTTTRAIASAASRMTAAAGDRPCIEMGSRRTHEEAAVAAARAAYVAGLRGHQQPRGRPPVRRARPPAPRRTPSPCCTTPSATRSRAQVAVARRGHDAARRHLRRRGGGRGPRSRSPGPALGAVRLDSGDLCVLARAGARPARRARRHRHPDHRHQSDLDEYAIAALAAGAGRRATASAPRWSPAPAHPTAGSSTSSSPASDDGGVMRPVEKSSEDKTSVGGRK